MSQVRELQGLALSPVPMDFDDKDPELAALGSYLVKYGMRQLPTPVPPSWPARPLFGSADEGERRETSSIPEKTLLPPYGTKKRVQLA